MMSPSVRPPVEVSSARAARGAVAELDEVTASHVHRAGLRAKCSFLLSVLSGDAADAGERAAAFVGLVDDIDSLGHALVPDDFARLRELLDRVLTASVADSVWTLTCFPDPSVTAPAAIDGVNVRRVVATAETDGAGVDVARIDLPAGTDVAVVVEYTCTGDQPATVLAVDEGTGEVFAECPLLPGHNRLASMVLPLGASTDPTRLTLRIENSSSDDPVFWYQAAFHAAQPSSPRSITDVLHDELRVARRTKQPSVFAPITAEPLALHDIDRLMALRDKFRGERIFVMGNGPSLNRTPLELLHDEYVFGVNRVSLLFDRLAWRPTFFTAFDVRVVPDNQEEFAELPIPYKFFSARYKSMMGERENHYWYHTKGHYEGFETAFEPTVVYSGFGGGGTIAVIAIELAFLLGFREIYLIGTDASYSVPATVKQSGDDAFGDGVKLELESTADDDANHFDPRYFGRGKKWHNPNVREMKIGLARAASYIERRGGVLRNATIGGELDEVPRVDFETLF
jgi:hypothetical protein